MAYGLSFSDDFYLDDDPAATTPSKRPTSIYQAIISLKKNQWRRLARDVFGIAPERLDPLAVLDRVRRTDTCGNLDAPVRVWIDEEGDYDLLVYDRPAE